MRRKEGRDRGSPILDVREERRICWGTSLALYAPSGGGMQMRLQFGAEGNEARVNMRASWICRTMAAFPLRRSLDLIHLASSRGITTGSSGWSRG